MVNTSSTQNEMFSLLVVLTVIQLYSFFQFMLGCIFWSTDNRAFDLVFFNIFRSNMMTPAYQELAEYLYFATTQ